MNRSTQKTLWRILIGGVVISSFVTLVAVAAESSDRGSSFDYWEEVKAIGASCMLVCAALTWVLNFIARSSVRPTLRIFKRGSELSVGPAEFNECYCPTSIDEIDALPTCPAEVDPNQIRCVFLPYGNVYASHLTKLCSTFAEVKMLDLQNCNLENDFASEAEVLADLTVLILPSSINSKDKQRIELQLPVVQIETGPLQVIVHNFAVNGDVPPLVVTPVTQSIPVP